MSKRVGELIFLIAIVLLAIITVDEDFKCNIGFLKITSAYNYEQSDNVHQAEEIFRRVSSNNPGLAKANRGLGFALAMQGRINDAKKIWPEGIFQLASIFTSWGDIAKLEIDYDSALYWYDKALEIDSSLGRVWYEVGIIQEQILSFDDALISFQEAISSGYVSGIHSIARLLLSHGEYSRAISILMDALEDYPRGEDRLKWYYDLVDSFQAEKQWDAAIEVAKEGINEFPEDPLLYVQLGRALYFGDKQLFQAIEKLKIAIEKDKHVPSAYSTLGDIMLQEQRFVEAYNWYSKALEYNSNSPWLYVSRANALRLAGDYDIALDSYLEAVKRYPVYEYGYFEIAWMYRLLGNQSGALDSIEKALSLSDKPILGFILRAGILYEYYEKDKEALDAYYQVLKMDSNNELAQNGIKRLLKKNQLGE
jgi:tetratricopeptide (TPR) repeat protein